MQDAENTINGRQGWKRSPDYENGWTYSVGWVTRGILVFDSGVIRAERSYRDDISKQVFTAGETLAAVDWIEKTGTPCG